MKRKTSIIVSAIFLVAVVAVFLSPTAVVANSFFWQGTDVSDSGDLGLIRYEDQKVIHDALLSVLPVELYPDGEYGLPGPGDDHLYDPTLDGLPNPNGSMQNGLVRMPFGELSGPPGLRIPCDSGECWDGYTLVDRTLVDMDGNIVHVYTAASGSFGGAAKMLKGGDVISSERGDLVQRDWCGVEKKRFPGLSNHHDHQREPSSVGYYYPGRPAYTNRGMTLSLGSEDVAPDDTSNPDKVEPWVTEIVNVKRFDENRPHRAINDDVIREIPWDWDGDLDNPDVWTWNARHHFVSASPSDLGLGLYDDEAANYALDLGLNSGGGSNRWGNIGRGSREDWTHGNTVAWLGPNPWFDMGHHKGHGKGHGKHGKKDYRFHPDNIIADFRSLNNIVIIARHDHPEGLWDEGAVVYRIGPNYGTDGPDGKIGQIIGPHMAYMIPMGLPGAGNILVFDNGGGAGYGALIEGLTDNNGTPDDPEDDVKLGFWQNKYRHFSRVLEINPITRQIVWQYVQAKPSVDEDAVGNDHRFYSIVMSGAQRLPNGNTLITEADTGRIFEVTVEGEVVWEYAPTWPIGFGNYRAYRIPYKWVHRKLLKDRDHDGTYDVCQ